MKLGTSDFSTPLFFQFFAEEDRDYVADVWLFLETILEHRMQLLTYDHLRMSAREHDLRTQQISQIRDMYGVYCSSVLKILERYPFLQENFGLYNSSEKISWDTFAMLIRKKIPDWNEKEGMFVFYSIFSGKFSSDIFALRLIADIRMHPMWREMRE